MKVNQIIKENARLQDNLTKENTQYYEKLLIYIRIMSMIRDEKKSEELLLEILEDILEGQEKGISAETYLGKNPKQVADGIIKELPINFMDFIKLVFAGFISFLLIMIIPFLTSFENYIDYGDLLITGIVATFFVISFLFLMGYTLYKYQSKVIDIVSKIYLFIGIIIIFLMLLMIKTGLRISLSNTGFIALIVFFLAVLSYIFIKTEEKRQWIPFIPPVIIFAVIGILMRLPFFKSYLEGINGKIIITIATILGYIFFVFLVWHLNKKSAK